MRELPTPPWNDDPKVRARQWRAYEAALEVQDRGVRRALWVSAILGFLCLAAIIAASLLGLVGCSGTPGSRPPDCPVCPPTPPPSPRPPRPSPTAPPPAMTGPDCIPGTLNCGCVDHPPSQPPTCVVCDSAAPGGVRAIGTVPVCPPASTPIPGPTPDPVYTLPPFPAGAQPVASKPTEDLNAAVRAATLTVALRYGDCNVGGDCSLGPDPQKAQQEIMAELQHAHVYAGQDEPGHSDEFVASLTGEERHAFHGVKYPNPGANAKAVWPQMPAVPCFGGKDEHGTPPGQGCPGVGGGSYRGQWLCAGGCPYPGASSCPVRSSDVEYYRFELKPHGESQQLDLTPYACGSRVRERMIAAGGDCGGSCCPLSQEKGPVNLACQLELYGTPLWRPVEGLSYWPEGGPFTVKIASGAGNISSKSTKGPSAQNQGSTLRLWSVAAGIPACAVASDGFCP